MAHITNCALAGVAAEWGIMQLSLIIEPSIVTVGFRVSERTVVACVRQLFFERSMSTTKIKREI